MLKRGASASKRDNEGRAPLQDAVAPSEPSAEALAPLLEHGPPVALKEELAAALITYRKLSGAR